MINPVAEIPRISKRKLKAIADDETLTARAAHLVHVSDREPGIERRGGGKRFRYYFEGTEIRDKETLARIRRLVIPPAWTRVWICRRENGHLQATGFDAMKRKQYRYHPSWSALRNHTKFYRLLRFGKALPRIRERLRRDLEAPGLSLKKVLATVVSLMERTNIRVGNDYYEKTYGSFGLTTLKNRHVILEGNVARFSFVGKKGIPHEVTLKNRKLVSIIRQCRDIPGKELFQFYDEAGNHHSIDSGLVNSYIREISEDDFTAKDFRTWAGTVHALMALKTAGCCDSESETKKRVVEALDQVSAHLGNTRAVCKKYYVHPLILSLYETGKLEQYLAASGGETEHPDTQVLTADEASVLKILESN